MELLYSWSSSFGSSSNLLYKTSYTALLLAVGTYILTAVIASVYYSIKMVVVAPPLTRLTLKRSRDHTTVSKYRPLHSNS